MKVVIVGGHGNVSMRLARLLSVKPSYQVISIIRNSDHTEEVAGTGATPLILSLEDVSKEKLAEAFDGADVVYFSAGAGGKGGAERTRQVDFEGAVKVFDALELVNGAKPRLIMVSAIDVRDPSKIPAHYNDADKARSEATWKAIGSYMQAKYDADKDLVQRTTFKWTILRPGALINDPGTGTASIGRVHIAGPGISRDDVASALALLAERPDAAGLGIDFVGGDDKIEEALDAFIKKGESDFLG